MAWVQVRHRAVALLAFAARFLGLLSRFGPARPPEHKQGPALPDVRRVCRSIQGGALSLPAALLAALAASASASVATTQAGRSLTAHATQGSAAEARAAPLRCAPQFGP